ncbi:MAG: sigma-70 family RNA polymerase sigma factor [Tannerellaceae bacterium]|jgi:RNA polymerase sigma factor (sigma-70 family)|nr:sigma-70 family RNA polymerase sigma factor [Tannerellaceae bacterium]
MINPHGGSSDIERLIAEYRPRLKRFIRSKVTNLSDADDILQDVFYQFVRTVKLAADPIEQVSAWLYRVARNMIINHGRKKREQELISSDSELDIALEFTDLFLDDELSPTPETEYLRNLIWSEIELALEQLPPAQREIYELTEFEGIPLKEIAAAAGIPLNTLLSRKRYAILQLRKRLRSLYDDILLR